MVLNSDGATGPRRLVGARPVEHGRGSCSVASEKNPIENGGQGVRLLGCLYLLGRDRVTLIIITSSQPDHIELMISTEQKKMNPLKSERRTRL